MSQALLRKLRVTPGTEIRTVNAPADYTSALAPLPTGVRVVQGVIRDHGFVHLFVKDRAQLERELPRVVGTLRKDGLLWISYPKGGSTDLDRDRGWEALEAFKLRWLALISFDPQWTAFLLKNAPPAPQSRASKEYHAAQQEWVDAATKTVRVPGDLATAFRRAPGAKRYFDALSFTNRKEYVLWVVGAKRAATRVERVKGSIEKLQAGWKNPSGR